MSGKLDLNIDRGTTFRFSFTWSITEPDGTSVPMDLTGATAELLMYLPKSSHQYESYTSKALTITGNTVEVELTAKETQDLTTRTEYAIKVTFANGDVKHPLEGYLLVNH
jgi:hypothetical protein